MAGKAKPKSKSAAKTRTAAKAAPAKQGTGAVRLRTVIETLIEAKRSGDQRGSAKATAELDKFSKELGTGVVQQAASEARAVAGHGVLLHSLNHLQRIAATLGN